MAVLVAFLIPLPTALEFPDEATFYRAEDSDVAAAIGHGSDAWDIPSGYSVGVQFTQVSAVRSYMGIEPRAVRRLQRSLVPLERRRLRPKNREAGCQTVAIAVTRMTDEDSSLSPVFDRCLAWTRHLCEAWRYTTRYDVLLPEYDSLPVSVASFTHDTESGTYLPGVMILRTDTPAALAAPMSPGDFEDKLGLMLQGMHMRHPQAVYQDRLREARCGLYRLGQRDNSVVLANTAVETLVDNTLTALAWDRGMTPEQAAKAYYKGQGLRQRVRIHLAELLEGDWDPAGDGPVAAWDGQLAKLRHKVVHEGYLPSRQEAVSALEALRGFEHHLISRVAARSLEFRKAAVLIAARQGLEDHDMYSDEFRRWVDEDMPEDLMQTYLCWRHELYALLE